MWIEREITDELIKITKAFPVLALIGPRQVGKTSILERTFPNYNYVCLDVGANAEAAETRPESFLKKYPPPVIIDEIQYAPSFFRHIKAYVDSHRTQKGLFIITGSQNFLLMQSIADSLAGRCAVIPFLGLSGSEWDSAEALRTRYTWEDFLWKGGFPALWAELDASPSPERWYQGYVATYLERDVRNIVNVGNLRDFERFLRACAARCSQTLNLSEIGRDVGISTTTSKQWLSILQASNQIFLLEPYYRSLGKRIAKSPKLYFTDTGLVSYLMGFGSPTALWSSVQAGALWENYVINQWLRWRDWHAPRVGLWYWRDQGGNEVDLILDIDQRLFAVECKLTERPDSSDLKGIRRLRKFYGDEMVERAYIAAPAEIDYEVDEGVMAVCGWKVWDI